MKCIRIQLAWSLLLAGYAGMAIADSDTDVSAGEGIYVQCTGCHAPEYHRTGPMHCGLVGRRAGSVAGFEFTAAMKNSNIVWNPETLNRFLQSPTTMVPGTSMGFAGIVSELERRQLIAFLATLTTDNPRCR